MVSLPRRPAHVAAGLMCAVCRLSPQAARTLPRARLAFPPTPCLARDWRRTAGHISCRSACRRLLAALSRAHIHSRVSLATCPPATLRRRGGLT